MNLLISRVKPCENDFNHNISLTSLKLLCYLFLFISNQSFSDIIPPNNLQSKTGFTSSQPLEVVRSQDQTGNTDNPSKYIEFKPDSTGYKGVFKFNIPSNISQNLNSLIFHANYRGPAMSTQRWIFRILNVQSGKWLTVADNSAASSWNWTTIKKAVNKDPNLFINGNGQVTVIYVTMGTQEDSQLDFLAIETIPNRSTTNTPTPVTNPTTPTAPPTQNSRWQPIIGTQWQIQYTGSINTSLNVAAFNLDLFDTDASVITKLHASGKHVICYFSAGSHENWRPDAGKFSSSVLGRDMDGWAGEKWLDVRQINTLIPLMKARMQLAANKGCDAVDPDNVDGYTNNTGFALNYNHQLTYNKALAKEAHSLGLAISLKNDLDQIRDLVNDFDFAVNESCFEYDECSLLTPFVKAGKPVFGIEYNLNTTSFCPQANASNLDFLKKNLSLDAARVSCR